MTYAQKDFYENGRADERESILMFMIHEIDRLERINQYAQVDVLVKLRNNICDGVHVDFIYGFNTEG